MIKSLSIVNYALIENLEIDFEKGFSVITGETGAGKSIILGALSLILGSRADLNVLKDSNRKCIIEGVFDNGSLELDEFFNENDLDFDNQTIIRRELLPSGKSRAFINDTPVTLKLINNLGNKFVNIHSQHQTLKLSDASFQLAVLDDFFIEPKLISEYQKAFSEYQKMNLELKNLIVNNERAARDADYFQFQFDELENAKLDSENIVELEEKAKFLEHSEEIKVALSEAEIILNDDDNSLVNGNSRLIKTLTAIVDYLPNAASLIERLKSVLIELEDVGNEISMLNSYEGFDSSELVKITDRLNQIYNLYSKHHVASVDELIALREDFNQKLLSISLVDVDIEKIKNQIEKLEKSISVKANKLHELRLKGGKKFSKSVIEVLVQLGMKDADFYVSVERVSQFNSTGISKVQFMFNANLGAKPGEISKIASGGELSRLMLAIKSLINQQQMMPTVVFDEIDSGVSGDIAGKVGKIIKKMSDNHQVISITHLPQIAAKADRHYKVYKKVSKSSTVTTIDSLDNDGRVEELAVMISSDNVTENALIVAREMIAE